MTVLAGHVRYTPDDLLMMPDGDRYELVGGELVEKEMGAESGWIGGRLLTRLSNFVDQGGLGWIFPSEVSYQCFPAQPGLVRRPDVSFIPPGRLPDERIPR